LLRDGLRICLITPTLAPYDREGGIGQYVRLLAEELGAAGHRVTVLGVELHYPDVQMRGTEVEQEAYGKSVSVPPFRIAGRWPGLTFRNLRAALGVRMYLQSRRHDFDIIETTNFRGHGAFLAGLGIPYITRLSTPASVMWGRGLNVRIINWMEARSCIKANLIIGNSQAIIDEVRPLYRCEAVRSVVIPHAVADIASPQVSPPTDRIELLYIGRSEHRKGTDILIRALARAMPTCETLRITLIGTELQGYLKEFVPELRPIWNLLKEQVGDRVADLGKVDEATKLRAIARSHWLIVPSRFESFGLMVPEAMRAGTPAVVSRGGALPTVAAAGSFNRVYGEPEDVDALTAMLMELFRLGPEEPLSYREETRRAYEKHYAPGAFTDQTIRRYKEVVEFAHT